MSEATEDKIVDIVSDVLVDAIKYFRALPKSALTIFLIGLVTYFLWPVALKGIVPALSFGQALLVALLARILAGPPNIMVEPPLDAEERALLIREQVEEEGGPALRAIPTEDD